MFGQPGDFQISTSLVNGADIVAPPAGDTKYVKVFARDVAGVMTFFCKHADGSVTGLVAGVTAVTCAEPA